MFNMNKKSNLDERQELTLLKIESRGCWLAFWGLLIMQAVQMVMYSGEWKQVAGEWIVFMALALYLWAACHKAGIYDRHLTPSPKTNLITSLLGGLAVTLLVGLMVWKNFPDKPVGAFAAGGMAGFFTFVLCYITMIFTSRDFVKRQQKLEAEEEDDME